MVKSSQTLTRLMLGLFALLMAAALFFGAAVNWQHKSYMAALAAALVLVLLLLRFARWGSLDRGLERLGAARLALVLAALGLAVNLLWCVTHRVEPDGDYMTFWITALAQARDEALVNRVFAGLFPHIMGYASFLSLFLRLLGSHLWVAVGVNLALTMLSGLLIFQLCLRWSGVRAAFFGGLLWALCPSAVMFNTMVLSEPYYTCLLLVYLYLISGLEKREAEDAAPRLWRWILGGMLGGVLLWAVNTARPIAPIILIATAIWILVLRGKGLTDRRAWLRWGLFFLWMLALYLPLGNLWDAYLTQRLGEEPAPVPGYNIYVGFNPDTQGSYSDEDIDLLFSYRNETGSAVQAQQCMLQEAKGRITSGQIRFPQLFAAKIRTLLGNDEAGAYYTRAMIPDLHFSLWSMLSNVFYYFVAILAVLFAWQMGRQKEWRTLLLVPLYVIGLTLAQMLVEVAARYHYSILPMLVILAACCLSSREASGPKASPARKGSEG